MNSDERESEEVDVTPYEGEPDFEDAPTAQAVADVQDLDHEEGRDDA